MYLKKRVAIFVFTCVLFFDSAHAVVITADVAINPAFFGNDKMLTLTKSIPDGSGLFAIAVHQLDTETYQFNPMGIAERYGLFQVSYNSIFDSKFAVTNNPIASNYFATGVSTEIFYIDESRYYGYWDDRNNDGIPTPLDNYGWVELTNTVSGLIASSSATAIGNGIYVGTLMSVPVPLPASFLLFISGLVGLFFQSRKNKFA